MSIAAITFDLDDQHTIQMVNNDLLIWVNGAEGHFAKESDLVITVEDMRHILDAANILGKQP